MNCTGIHTSTIRVTIFTSVNCQYIFRYIRNKTCGTITINSTIKHNSQLLVYIHAMNHSGSGLSDLQCMLAQNVPSPVTVLQIQRLEFLCLCSSFWSQELKLCRDVCLHIPYHCTKFEHVYPDSFFVVPKKQPKIAEKFGFSSHESVDIYKTVLYAEM